MIFIQHGPSWKPKTDEILKMNLAQGIIWDPREETIERIEAISFWTGVTNAEGKSLTTEEKLKFCRDFDEMLKKSPELAKIFFNTQVYNEIVNDVTTRGAHSVGVAIVAENLAMRKAILDGKDPNEAEEDWHDAFVDDCKKDCASKGIKAISEETLAKCFQMPENGVEVEHIYFKTRYYPSITSTVLDCVAIEKLGTYAMNNGKVVFVYVDGKTYVAKGYKIIDELQKAGYREGELFVPFSNGETIVDPFLKKKWDDIKK